MIVSLKRSPWCSPASVFVLPIWLCLCGCRTAAPDTAAPWREHRAAANYRAAKVTYVGIAVTDFAWYRESLTAWGWSRDLIGKSLQSWLGVPPAQQIMLTNPRLDELQDLFRQQLAAVPQDHLVVIYLGTHQLKGQRVLLGHKEEIAAKDLLALLGQVKQRCLLLADVCYAAAFEQYSMPQNCLRIYAGNDTETVPEIRFRGRAAIPGAVEFFARTRNIIARDLQLVHDRYSLLGLLFTQTLIHQVELAPPVLTAQQLTERIQKEAKALRQRVRKHILPRVDVRNSRPWPLARLTTSKGVAFRRLARMLNGPQEEIRLETGLWLVSQLYDPGVRRELWNRELERLTTALRPRLRGVVRPSQKVAIVSAVVFNKPAINCKPDAYAEDFLLDRLLANRAGRCMSLTALFLVLGERLGLPLHAVCVPEHQFVRYQSGPDKAYVNVETTEKGIALPDREYRRRHPWERTERANSFYLRTLTKRRVLATFVARLGDALREQGRPVDALAALLLALQVNPDDPEAWNSLGVLHAARGRKDTAGKAYRQALAINDQFAEAWNNLGNLETNADKRLAHYQKAVRLKPELAPAWAELSYLWHARGNDQKAWTCARRCLVLRHPLPAEYLKKLKRRIEQDD